MKKKGITDAEAAEKYFIIDRAFIFNTDHVKRVDGGQSFEVFRARSTHKVGFEVPKQ